MNIFYISTRVEWLTSGTLTSTGVRWSGDNTLTLRSQLDKLPDKLHESGLLVDMVGGTILYEYTGEAEDDFLWEAKKLAFF